MSISYVNIDKKNNEPKLSLCLPNLERTKIGNLTDIYDAELTINMGILNELSFTMPMYVERNRQKVKNPLIEKFNGLYHVRVEWNGRTEYFVYTKGNRKLSSSGKEYQYRLLSTGHLLSKKIIRSYEEVSKSLTWFVVDFLRETDWFIGYVDADFDLIKRTYETTESSVLQSVFDIAEKFGALIEWDTVNQKINFMKPQNSGVNKGFKIREGIFLESLDAEINYDEVVTRLYVYGEDGLEFRRLSPTGSNYIESFDWFMHPFDYIEVNSNDTSYTTVERTQGYKILKSSKYMGDGLCVAIRKYEKKVSDSNPQFKTLTTQKTSKQDEIQQREQELSVLQTQLNTILNERDIINATYMDEAPSRSDWQNAISRMNAKNVEIASKTAQITNLKSQLASIDTQILNLRESLKVDNNYTSEQLREMNKFIISKTYTNDSISNEQDLLDDGAKAFKEYNVPPTSLNISLVNFLKDFEFKDIKNRIAIGDTATAKLEDLDLDLSMKISQIKYNFESESVSLTVTNLKDLRDDWQQFLAKIYTASNTSTTVDMSKHLWDTVTTTNDTVTKLIKDAFDTAKNVLLGGTQNTVTITERGLYNRDVNDPNVFMVINAGILAITKDGGNSVEVSINKDGVFANKLHGKILLSNKLWVEDDLGVIEIQSGLQTVYDQNGIPRVFLGRYPTYDNPNVFDYGLRIDDGKFTMRTSTTDKRGIQIDGQGIRGFNSNGVKTFDLDTSGHASFNGSITIKSSPDSNKGVVIDGDGLRGYNSAGALTFEINNNGSAWFSGRLVSATGSVNDLTGSIKDMTGTYIGSIDSNGTFKGITTGTLSAQTVNAINIKADQITSGKISSQLIDTNSLTAATIKAEQITSGKISSQLIDTQSLSAANITAEQITSGSIDGDRIAISGRMQIYGGIQLHSGAQYSGLYFGSNQIHEESDGTLRIRNKVSIGSFVEFDGQVDFSRANVTGL